MSHKESQSWTLIIKPKVSWFEVNLKDVWRYKDLIAMFVKRDFISAYKQTILGPLWFLIQPLLTTLMLLFVFGGIANIATPGIPSILFYLSGLAVWNYFATCFIKTSTTFVGNTNLFGKVYFPRLVLPISTVISTMVIFCIQFLLFLSFLIYYAFFKGLELHFSVYLLLIPYLVLLMATLGLGLGIIISSLTTKYRDLANLIGFGIQLLMYLTTVAYPLSAPWLTGKKRFFVLANPMTSVIESFRYAFFPIGHFRWALLGYTTFFSLCILFIGVLLFNKTEKNFMDTV